RYRTGQCRNGSEHRDEHATNQHDGNGRIALAIGSCSGITGRAEVEGTRIEPELIKRQAAEPAGYESNDGTGTDDSEDNRPRFALVDVDTGKIRDCQHRYDDDRHGDG